jgi:hypothetical protein
LALGTGAIIGSAAAIGIGSADAPLAKFSETQYRDALDGARAQSDRALARCETAEPTDRELCRTQATAEATIRVADIEERYRHDDRTARESQRARIDARYQVARTLCQPLRGFQKDRCLIQAHAARGRALLQAQAPYERR